MGKKKNFYSIEFKINVIERYNSGDEGLPFDVTEWLFICNQDKKEI